MKWLLIPLVVLVILILLVAIIGALLPRNHTATRSAFYHQTPQALYAVIHDFANGASWRTDVQSITLLPPENGHLRWREHSRHGDVTYAVIEDRPTEKLVVKIMDESLPYGGTWTYDFAPAPQGATLRITENGEVKNILFRFMARFVIGYTGTMNSTLSALGKKFGEEVRPAG